VFETVARSNCVKNSIVAHNFWYSTSLGSVSGISWMNEEEPSYGWIDMLLVSIECSGGYRSFSLLATAYLASLYIVMIYLIVVIFLNTWILVMDLFCQYVFIVEFWKCRANF